MGSQGGMRVALCRARHGAVAMGRWSKATTIELDDDEHDVGDENDKTNCGVDGRGVGGDSFGGSDEPGSKHVETGRACVYRTRPSAPVGAYRPPHAAARACSERCVTERNFMRTMGRRMQGKVRHEFHVSSRPTEKLEHMNLGEVVPLSEDEERLFRCHDRNGRVVRGERGVSERVLLAYVYAA